MNRRTRSPGSILSSGLDVLRAAAREFQADRARRLSAGLAYYSIFALVPVILLAVVIAGALVGQEAAEGRLANGLDDLIGEAAAQQIEDAVAETWERVDTSSFAVVNGAIVLFSASVLFVAWRDTLELVWDVPYEPTLRTSLRARALGVLVPAGAGVMIAIVVGLELVLGLAASWVSSPLLDAAVRVTGNFLPMLAASFALGLLYRHTTRRYRPEWRDVWPGTLVASVALAVGSWGYGVYVRVVGSTSLAGAASTVVIGLALVYYAAQILLYGAEVIKVLGERRGHFRSGSLGAAR